MSHINLHTGRGLENIILLKLELEGGCKVKMAQSRAGHSGSKERIPKWVMQAARIVLVTGPTPKTIASKMRSKDMHKAEVFLSDPLPSNTTFFIYLTSKEP
jgi:hypothetical protein